MLTVLKKLLHRLDFGTVHGLAHLLYFGAVFVEGHGLYALMGGVLLALGLAAVLFQEGGAE